MWYLATAVVVSAGAPSPQNYETLVCVCARFFGVFFWFWVCMDMDSARSGVQLCAPDNSIENDGYPQIIVETTLALIKPDAIDRSEAIVDIIIRSGFSVLRVRLLYFSVCHII